MGIYLANPTLSWMVMHEQIPIVPMVKRYQHVFAFNQTFMDTLTRLHQECGYADYLAKVPPSFDNRVILCSVADRMIRPISSV
jgi:hypothetical protein